MALCLHLLQLCSKCSLFWIGGVFFFQDFKDCFSFNDFVWGKYSFCFLV